MQKVSKSGQIAEFLNGYDYDCFDGVLTCKVLRDDKWCMKVILDV